MGGQNASHVLDVFSVTKLNELRLALIHAFYQLCQVTKLLSIRLAVGFGILESLLNLILVCVGSVVPFLDLVGEFLQFQVLLQLICKLLLH